MEDITEDITIVCSCGNPFTFTVGEQRFFKERGFVMPKRCPDCRRKKRQERLNSPPRPFRDDVPFSEDEER